MVFYLITFSILLVTTLASPIRSDPVEACGAIDIRAQRVKKSFLHAYNGYKRCAWKHDELLPVSCQPSDSRNHWGATIVDGLDTMLMMGLEKEYDEALHFINRLNFSYSDTLAKGFETNIRYLGGMLAANDLRPNKMLVRKSVELAEAALVPLFVKTTSGLKVPYTNMDLNTGMPEVVSQINLAEFGTYTMEFTRLSQVTGDAKYEKLAMDLTKAILDQTPRLPGLYPSTWTVDPFKPIESSLINMGGGGDSFYEYLIKNYLLQEKKDISLLNTWKSTVDSIQEYMLSPTAQDPSIQFVAMLTNSSVYYVSQELICYWPGNILLGATQIPSKHKRRKYLKFANVFFRSCLETWYQTATGIAPESWTWTPSDDRLETKLSMAYNTKVTRARVSHKSRTFTIDNSIYDLRPETLESVFYYYRATGDTRFQDIAWKLYLSIDRYTKTKYGYTAINNVDDTQTTLENFQESFLFAETMKYLYLTFTDTNCISLNDYVFNTEAHPFKLPQPIHYQA
ncbi:maturation of Asn-linked oligosaccharides protein [Rhizopus stolonifer]|uniref:alpha-1,2-Mannosidase n=1 Tax=Rhizopus stolonifer TaxID=4846 RepID=A0A367KKY2_RHIST|nr:maturation of Asn-linked oligosaccharides protein [Rhizopus stolonifer]